MEKVKFTSTDCSKLAALRVLNEDGSRPVFVSIKVPIVTSQKDLLGVVS